MRSCSLACCSCWFRFRISCFSLVCWLMNSTMYRMKSIISSADRLSITSCRTLRVCRL